MQSAQADLSNRESSFKEEVEKVRDNMNREKRMAIEEEKKKAQVEIETIRKQLNEKVTEILQKKRKSFKMLQFFFFFKFSLISFTTNDSFFDGEL